jgi:hypothetical protein
VHIFHFRVHGDDSASLIHSCVKYQPASASFSREPPEPLERGGVIDTYMGRRRRTRVHSVSHPWWLQQFPLHRRRPRVSFGSPAEGVWNNRQLHHHPADFRLNTSDIAPATSLPAESIFHQRGGTLKISPALRMCCQCACTCACPCPCSCP